MLKDEKGGPDAMLPHPRAKAKIAKTTVAPFGSSPFFPLTSQQKRRSALD